MNRILARLTLVAAGLLLCSPASRPGPAVAQTDTAAICVSTFADMNGNGLRDDTETALAGVKVNLSLEGALVATHVTTGDGAPHCFENLPPGIYTVTFTDSPTYRTTTSNTGTFDLAEGQRLTIDPFGAVPIPPKWNTNVTAADTSAICISAYEDTNENGTRDGDEKTLAGVNVNLATGGVIIATHITTDDGAPYCFEDLSPDIYTITFTDSPTYQATTLNEGSFALADGQRLTLDGFGALPVPVDDLRAKVGVQIDASQSGDEPLETSVRLLLSTVGSMVVMIFMIGTGAVILGMISGRRERPGLR